MKPWPHDLMAIERQLLQSVVTVARYIYGAAASSVFMVSPDTGELIFAAVAGEGEQGLVGRRFEPGTGIAGWVAASGQPLITDDVAATDRFARDAAASTGYVPASIMAAPLIADGECIGVIEVLDRHAHDANAPGRELDDIELLGLLATQAALSLALLRRGEQAAGAAPRMGELVARLSEHAVMDASDPLAVSLLRISLDLLDRGAHPSSKVV
ncbi:GAF domain-containing protein [Streptomyces sp. NBC_00335]|uniref:GAF domain-containing protein n=1 Tax=unclassified Streptomyces TaxID=2593676 RepID=UPI0022584FC1|nr:MULTISPECIES: GAF domain-containing protein [unclassified Streptomyces]MCX5403303.1 GAF domain-containing protein [Streptomyces sp. NBC_00086]